MGLPDDTRLVVAVPMPGGGVHYRPIIGAGYGPDVDPTDEALLGMEFPLVAGNRDDDSA